MVPLMEQPIFISNKSTPLDKAPLSTLATVVIPAALGGWLGAIGLIAGPVGLLGIPLIVNTDKITSTIII